MGFLGMGPMRQVIKKGLLRRPYLLFADYVNVAGYLYLCGALLGRAKRDKLTILVRMISQPGRESDLIGFLQGKARERLGEYTDTYGQEPNSFLLLFSATEYKKMGSILPFGESEQAPTDRELREHMEQVTRIAESKMPLQEVEPLVKIYGQEGIGFGSSFPELTEKMYRQTFETIDFDLWSRARQSGLRIPEEPTMIPLEEQEETVLSMTAFYTQEYFPELINPLDFTAILDRAQAAADDSEGG